MLDKGTSMNCRQLSSVFDGLSLFNDCETFSELIFIQPNVKNDITFLHKGV